MDDRIEHGMSDLTNVPIIKAILAQYGLRPQKRLGQHFLIDRTVLQRLLAAAEISSTDTVVEVGAGIGTITVELAKKAKEVYAVEIDKNLIPILKSHINDFKSVNVIQEDILKMSNERENFEYKVIGAIPYSITSPLLHHLLTQKIALSLIAIIVQKEVAEKITACPPKATYLSNFVGIFGEAEIIGRPIPPSSFWPQPEVYSSILRITQHPKISFSASQLLSYSAFLHQGFSHPRKMLNKVFDKKLLAAAGITPTRRAQTLTKDEWLHIFEISN